MSAKDCVKGRLQGHEDGHLPLIRKGDWALTHTPLQPDPFVKWQQWVQANSSIQRIAIRSMGLLWPAKRFGMLAQSEITTTPDRLAGVHEGECITNNCGNQLHHATITRQDNIALQSWFLHSLEGLFD